ncbi:Glycosyl hydrolases family 2, TIM barrel domain [Arenibacter nanhaiticus]|uniref:Glycosyl hydrolases family 2, TIM barrel domain n=1 Tax=Arenibacter nanhaiticus TaxID=558155 RepID=A0A1M6CD83_9FLAO|nr:glycoside hydrolase family 2 TIM barrel-domain containing protein [Arenibacter nanhaiticus]SHI58843.1 Glycosyl hydrolases family 2, TIM barrel domain [Arenibacter nanhaiticus]
MNWKKIILIVLAATFNNSIKAQKDTIDLSGAWNVTLNSDIQIGDNISEANKMKGMIQLPSSLAQQGFGFETKGSDFGVLTPEYKYLGVASFEKEIIIPKNWKDKQLTVFLERVLWQSKIFIDGKELSTQDALGTPHVHKIGKLSPGKHRLVIEVDNEMIHNIGDKGHAYGDYTQGIWNGIVGKMEIKAKDPTYIQNVRTFSLLNKDQLKVEVGVIAQKDTKTDVILQIQELGKPGIIKQLNISRKLNIGSNNIEIILDLEGQLKKWSEFEPIVYSLKTKIKTKKHEDIHETEFGYQEIGHNGTHITINGAPIFLRGNLDCVHFPLTGYPSTEVEDWVRIFKTYKEYGLNHARFHSWCPPEAAFKAANRVGIYLQAEASIWIDWWMSEDMKIKGRPEMDTKGYPKGLGLDPERDAFVIEEMNRVVDTYGNHPSFTMFCIGNELGNSDFDIMKGWVADLKNKDNRRLYSVSTARKITDVDDYMATHYIQGVGRTRGLNGARTDWDFEDIYSQMNIPIIAHEIGQWPVYPTWDEIYKYTGVLKARNLEGFKEVAEKNGIADQDHDFKMASGALNQIMYKYEIESFLRTKSCAGIQLLSMQDYQGQGEALIGWLDAHWDSKGITSPEKFKQHFDETVPLLRMKKFVWETDETFEASAQISHYGQFTIKEGTIIAKILTKKGTVLKEEKWSITNLESGSLTDIGSFKFPLKSIDRAQQLTISLALENSHFKNTWDIWVYPSQLPNTDESEIYFTHSLDSKAMKALEKGRKVMLFANQLGTEKNSVGLNFYPLYWSLTFFPGQGKTNIGLLIQNEHPAFDNFPTSYHSDWQWEAIMGASKAFILNTTPKEYKPIVQVVDDFHRNNKEGVVFEFGVGKGKLLVCGFDIASNDSPVAKQLQYSLEEYIKSNAFNPKLAVDNAFLEELFPLIPKAEETTINEGFKNILLQVRSASLLKIKNTDVPWSKEVDQIIVQKEGVAYNLQSDGVWKDGEASGWHGEKMSLTIDCPSGILGSFYVLFDDWNHKNREGFVEFEGRKVQLGAHDTEGGKWVKFHVMREDSNDGKLVLKTSASKGGNLMIRQIVLEKE